MMSIIDNALRWLLIALVVLLSWVLVVLILAVVVIISLLTVLIFKIFVFLDANDFFDKLLSFHVSREENLDLVVSEAVLEFHLDTGVLAFVDQQLA